MLAQPAGETGDSANGMLGDELYTRIPKPDFAIALHDTPDLETGKVGYTPGYAMASATSIDVKIRAVRREGQAPKKHKARAVPAPRAGLAFQPTIGRKTSPPDPAVVTAGSSGEF